MTPTAAPTPTAPLALLPSAVTVELLAALLDTVAAPVAVCVPLEAISASVMLFTLAMATAAATSTLPSEVVVWSLYLASVSSLLLGAAAFSVAVCFFAPLVAALALVVTVLVDSAATLSAVALVVALPSMIACVTLVTSESASVPPTATAPPAVESALVVAVTVFFAVRSSVPPVAVTVLVSPTCVLAVLTTTLTATPASPGSVVGFGPPGVAFEVTLEVDASVALPPDCNDDAP